MKSKERVVGTAIAILFLFGCAPRSHSTKNSAPPNTSQDNKGTANTSAQNSAQSHTNTSGTPNSTSRGGLLVPFTGAALGVQSRIGQIPNDVPPATAINTKGGRLLVGYLRGTFSGETVVDQVFDTQRKAPIRLGEISAAILKLRNAGQFSAEDEDKVQILDTALNKRLIQTIQDHDRYGRYFKYGTATVVALVTGAYAPEIVDAGSNALDSSIVQTPKNAIVNGIKRGYQTTSDWISSLFRRGSKSAAEGIVSETAAEDATAASRAASAAGATAAGVAPQQAAEVAASEAAVEQAAQVSRPETFDDVAGTVGESTNGTIPGATGETVTGETVSPSGTVSPVVKAVRPSLYIRVMGALKTRFGRLTPEQVIVRDMARALPPQLARGFEVIPVAPEQMEIIRGLKFNRTGIPYLAMNQVEGTIYLTVRTITSKGYEYFYVRGRGVETITEDGHRLITTGPTVIGMAASRMRGWAQDTAGFFRRGTTQVKDWTTNSRLSQMLTSEAGKKWIQSTAVGSASGLLTFWALDPINTRYLTVNDYLLALSKKGINLNDFPDDLRTELQNEAKVPTQLAQPLD